MNTNKKTILVVDDDQDILNALRFILEVEGYTVVTTEKGEYVENLHDQNGALPNLIILDVLLSGKDGRLICKELKTKAVTKQIPIIMVSAHPDAYKSVKEVGADAFLAKPFDLGELLKIVKSLIADK